MDKQYFAAKGPKVNAVLPLAYPHSVAEADAKADASDSSEHAQFQVFLPQFVIQ